MIKQKTSLFFIPVRLFLIFLFLIASGTPNLRAQSVQLQELWALALKNNYQLRAQQKTVQASRLQVDIQQTTLLPTVSLQGGYTYISELARLKVPFTLPGFAPFEIEAGVKNQYDLALTVSQPIFTGFQLQNKIRAVKAVAKSQQAQLALSRNQLLLNVGVLYYQIVANLLQQRILKESVDRAEIHLQQVRAFYRAGQATALDTLEVANRKLQLKTQLRSSYHAKIILENKLRQVLNVNENYSITYPEQLPLIVEKVEKKQLLDLAYRNRPEITYISHLQEKQLFQQKAIQSGYLPRVYALASYHYARPGVNFFKDEWMKYYTVGINFQWELWSWGRTKKSVQQAKIEHEKLTLERQRLLQNIKRQIGEALENLQSAEEEIYLNKQLVEKEKERFRMTQSQFEQGQVSSLDLSDAEKSLMAAELQWQTSIVKYYIRKLELTYYTGTIGKN